MEAPGLSVLAPLAKLRSPGCGEKASSRAESDGLMSLGWEPQRWQLSRQVPPAHAQASLGGDKAASEQETCSKAELARSLVCFRSAGYCSLRNLLISCVGQLIILSASQSNSDSV